MIQIEIYSSQYERFYLSVTCRVKKPRSQIKPKLLQSLLQQEVVNMSTGERCKVLAPHGNEIVCNICLPERVVTIGRSFRERILEHHVKSKFHLCRMRKFLIVGEQ